MDFSFNYTPDYTVSNMSFQELSGVALNKLFHRAELPQCPSSAISIASNFVFLTPSIRLCVLEQEQECLKLAEHALIVYATC